MGLVVIIGKRKMPPDEFLRWNPISAIVLEGGVTNNENQQLLQ